MTVADGSASVISLSPATDETALLPSSSRYDASSPRTAISRSGTCASARQQRRQRTPFLPKPHCWTNCRTITASSSIVAGTNKTEEDDPDEPKRIGAPADSINSLVVNATSLSSEPASYTRQGPALRFFRKPDVSYFGGDSTGRMTVYGPSGIAYTNGTSFAAPWIARKIAYLIHVMNLSRETAKALLIDAASGWAPTVRR